MAKKIHVAASCDDNYAQHVGVLIQSLLSNTANPDTLWFHLISDNISPVNQQHLKKIVNSFQAHLEIIPADNDKYSMLPSSRYGAAAYQRISLADYLPSSIDKVIYLDSDIIVLNDIEVLWNISLEGKPLAAIENLSPKASIHLGFSRKEYFNSGVLLIDLKQWRERNTHKETLKIVKDNLDKIQYFDQCSLNMIFRGEWKRLALSWNQQADIYGVLKKYADGCSYSKQDIQQAIINPNIVHFIGTQKPWLLNCFHPFKQQYQFFLAQTPWKNEPYKDNTLINRVKYFLAFRKKIKQLIRMREILNKNRNNS